MNNKTILAALFGFIILLSVACKKEKEHEEHENELITTVELSFVKTGTSETSVFTWADVDGPGGQNPVIDDIVLEANAEYSFTVRFLDQSKNPEEDITEEIEEEGEHHRVYYIPHNISLTFSELNKDDDGITLGLYGKVLTGSTGSGRLQLILRHYPNGGKQESDSPSAPAAGTDADVQFNVILD